MSIEAAYHEAAHAVLTVRSRLHTLSGVVKIDGGGSGTGFVDAAASRSKCEANGISPANAGNNSVVVREFVRILCAGYAGEWVAKEKGLTVTPDLNRSHPDYLTAQGCLSRIGLSKKLNGFSSDATELVRQHWDAIDSVAKILLEKGECDAVDIYEMLGEGTPLV